MESLRKIAYDLVEPQPLIKLMGKTLVPRGRYNKIHGPEVKRGPRI